MLELFLAFAKTGLFTIGGGYAMIAIIEDLCVNQKKWMTSEDMMELIVIAESTPGPIAINCATYIGYKKERFLGAIASTLGMIIPSFTIIYLISLFFNQFLSITWVASAFKGIQVCVIFLILSAGLKMLKKIKKAPFTIGIMSATFLCMLTLSLFAINFSSIFYILISACLGILLYSISYFKSKKNKSNEEEQK